MNKFIAWDKIDNQLHEVVLIDFNDETVWLEKEGQESGAMSFGFVDLFQSTGKTDIHGDEIYYDFHIVRFKYNEFSWEPKQEYIGVIKFDSYTLRAKIIVYKDNKSMRFGYIPRMSNFEIIGNIKQNPELVGEGK